MKQTILKVEGMSCAGCATSVRRALQQVPGVREVSVDLGKASATVEHEDTVSAGELATAVNDAGYDAAAPAA